MLQRDPFQDANVYELPHREKRRGMKPTFKGMIVWHVTALFLHLCQSMCSCNDDTAYLEDRYLIDLSHEFNEDTIYWVTAKQLHVNVTHNGTVEGKDYWYHIEDISAGTHGGTHLDAPCHFVNGRWCVSDIPLERLVAPAVVVDISDYVGSYTNRHLETIHLLEWEEKHGRIPNGSILLVMTGWARYWPDRRSYMGTTEKDVKQLKFPSIKPEAAEWLVENRDIIGIGIDSMSVDIPGSVTPLTHITLEDKNIFGIENINENLDRLRPTGTVLYVMPMKLKGASGAPCRVIASVIGRRSGAMCSQFTCSATVIALSCAVIYVLWLDTARIH